MEWRAARPPGLEIAAVSRKEDRRTQWNGGYMKSGILYGMQQRCIEAGRVAAQRWPISGKAQALASLALLAIVTTAPTRAIDLVAFTGISGPLASALATLALLGPGVKALMGFISFVVAFISLAGLRNFQPVLGYAGVTIFGAVGLVIGGSIM